MPVPPSVDPDSLPGQRIDAWLSVNDQDIAVLRVLVTRPFRYDLKYNPARSEGIAYWEKPAGYATDDIVTFLEIRLADRIRMTLEKWIPAPGWASMGSTAVNLKNHYRLVGHADMSDRHGRLYLPMVARRLYLSGPALLDPSDEYEALDVWALPLTAEYEVTMPQLPNVMDTLRFRHVGWDPARRGGYFNAHGDMSTTVGATALPPAWEFAKFKVTNPPPPLGPVLFGI